MLDLRIESPRGSKNILMARIRSIHPGLLTDEAYMTLTVEQPLAIALYLGLLMESDDYGVFEWKPLTIKARVLPAATTNVEDLLQVLVRQRFIATFEVSGRKLGAIRNFCRYQRPKKPSSFYPRDEAVDAWVKRGDSIADSPIGTEVVPNQLPTVGEKPPQMEDGGCSRKEDICPKPEKPVRTRNAYSEDFERFWSAYPTDKLMSKQETWKVWSKLTEDDRASANAAIPGFVAHCRKDPTYRAVHAVRFLSQRRFDGFAPQQKPTGPAPRGSDDPVYDFPGGFRRSESFVVKAIAAWRMNPQSWPWQQLGSSPDLPGCMVPKHLLDPHLEPAQ